MPSPIPLRTETPVFPRPWAIVLALSGSLGVIGCTPSASSIQATTSKEYFPSSVYGAASPRLISTGPIPRGGGQYLVGRPYVVAGRLYIPHPMLRGSTEVGQASWYGDAFHGRRTANGEIYDKNAISAAHPTMPLPSLARVTNMSNGRSIIVRVNDRGPYHPGRVMDVSSRVADLLDFKRRGMAQIRVDYVGPAPLQGSDDAQLLASLRTDGAPAEYAGLTSAPASRLMASLHLPSLFHRGKTSPPAPRVERALAPEPAASDLAQSAPEAPTPSARPIPASFATGAPLPPPRPESIVVVREPEAAGRASAFENARTAPRHRKGEQSSDGADDLSQ